MKKNLFKLLGISLISLLLVGCNSNIHDSESNVSEHGTNVSEHGIKVRSLGSGTDVDGYEYKTYAYVVVPSNSTTPIAASVSFADSRADGSSYLTATVDNAVKEFTITCIAPFDSQATVRIYATIGSAYADVTVDYRQRLITSTFGHHGGFVVGDANTTSLFWSDFSNGHHSLVGNSVFTIPETFTYSGLKSYTLGTGSDIPTISNITTQPNLIPTVLDLRQGLDTAISAWLSYSVKYAEGDQQDKDLYTHISEFLSGLTASEKNVLGTAEVNGLIRINFVCPTLSHYYDTTRATDLSYSSSQPNISFNIPASLYQNYGVYKNVQSVTPSVDSVEF